MVWILQVLSTLINQSKTFTQMQIKALTRALLLQELLVLHFYVS